MDRITVAVYSPDPLTVPGLISFLCMNAELRIVAIRRISIAQVAVVAADSFTGEVAAILERIHAHSAARIVLVVDELTDADLRLAVRCGVVNVLPRSSAGGPALVSSVAAARQPTPQSPAEITSRLMAGLEHVQPGVFRTCESDFAKLARRELDLLRLLAAGYDTAEIAARLAYSERTVKNILHALQGRLQLRNRAHAVAYAVRAGLV
jgi:DNA-binding NarL/FixJ family response regulator